MSKTPQNTLEDITNLITKYESCKAQVEILSTKLKQMRDEKEEAYLKKTMSLPAGYLINDHTKKCGNCYLRDGDICIFDMSARPSFNDNWDRYIAWRQAHTVDLNGVCPKHKEAKE